MDEEIDIGPYVAVLYRYWPWILGLAAAAAIAGFLTSLLFPFVYRASALVVVTQSRYAMQFDPRLETVELQNPQYKVFPALAKSNAILQTVVSQYTPSESARLDPWEPETIAKIVEADTGADPSLVVLNVRSLCASDASGIANTWADTLVRRGNEIYGQSEKDETFFAQQAAEAAQALQRVDAALIEFEGRNRASTISAELEAKRAAEASFLQEQEAIVSITQDVQGFRNQLAQQPEGQSGMLANQITALLLQVKAFNAQDGTPLHFQIDSSGLLPSAALPGSGSIRHSAEEIALLDGLLTTLAAKSAEIDSRVAALEPQILALQGELQSIQAENDRLTQARDLARETYVTLSRKLEEARISSQEEYGVLQVGSYAIVPSEPAAPRRLLIAAIAGALGLLVGLAGAFCLDLRRRSAAPPPQR